MLEDNCPCHPPRERRCIHPYWSAGAAETSACVCLHNILLIGIGGIATSHWCGEARHLIG